MRRQFLPIADLVILGARNVDVGCGHRAHALAGLPLRCHHVDWHVLVLLWILYLTLQLSDLLGHVLYQGVV